MALYFECRQERKFTQEQVLQTTFPAILPTGFHNNNSVTFIQNRSLDSSTASATLRSSEEKHCRWAVSSKVNPTSPLYGNWTEITCARTNESLRARSRRTARRVAHCLSNASKAKSTGRSVVEPGTLVWKKWAPSLQRLSWFWVRLNLVYLLPPSQYKNLLDV